MASGHGWTEIERFGVHITQDWYASLVQCGGYPIRPKHSEYVRWHRKVRPEAQRLKAFDSLSFYVVPFDVAVAVWVFAKHAHRERCSAMLQEQSELRSSVETLIEMGATTQTIRSVLNDAGFFERGRKRAR